MQAGCSTIGERCRQAFQEIEEELIGSECILIYFYFFSTSNLSINKKNKLTIK